MQKISIQLLLLISLSQQAQTASVANVYTGFSSEVTQMAQFAADGVAYALDYIEQVAQYKKLVETYKNQFKSYKLMLQNIDQLSPRQWNEFTQSVIGLKQALEFGEGMSYTMANYDQEFSKLFKGYNHYLTQAQNENTDFIGTYGKLNKRTRDMANAALKSLGLQASDMQSDEATMQYLQSLSTSSKGQKSAIQAASQIALHQTHTLKKLQQTMMTQVNLQGQYMLESSEKKSFQEAISHTKATKGIKPIIGDETRVTKW
jgi:P-type conjugative transfer protein TrbJ